MGLGSGLELCCILPMLDSTTGSPPRKIWWGLLRESTGVECSLDRPTWGAVEERVFIQQSLVLGVRVRADAARPVYGLSWAAWPL